MIEKKALKVVAMTLAVSIFSLGVFPNNVMAKEIDTPSSSVVFQDSIEADYITVEPHVLKFATMVAAAKSMIGGNPTLVAGTTSTFTSVVNGVRRTVTFSGTSGVVEAVSGVITWIVNITG